MSRRERLINNGITALDGGINASTTTVNVVDGSVFPSEGDFRIRVDDEIMLATARSSDTLTVERGVEGTSGAIHSSGAIVSQVLTEDAVETYVRESVPFHGFSPPVNRISGANGAILTVSDFTWVNQGTSTAADENGLIRLDTPAASGANVRALTVAAPSAPWAAVCAVSSFHVAVGFGTYPRAGLWIMDADNELIHLGAVWLSDAQGARILVQRFTNTTTFSAERYPGGATPGVIWQMPRQLAWLRIRDDNTDLFFDISPDGVNWTNIHSEGRTAFFAAGPNRIGIGSNVSTASFGMRTYFHHFSIE